MIYNIMDNAVKYATEKPQISIQSKENSKGLVLKFTDNGCGIPENDLPLFLINFIE
ncbi:MAG: ATP-binding protein [Flavobacterium sp.]|nr:ATP-binding protein [Flavobacterium sp.]